MGEILAPVPVRGQMAPIGRYGAMKLQWIGTQQNVNLQGRGFLRKPRPRGDQNGGGGAVFRALVFPHTHSLK